MGTIDIGWPRLCVGLLLLLIPLYCLWRYKTGMVRGTLWAALRMVVQLFLVGLYLKYLFLWDNPLLNSAWALVMVFVAGESAITRTRLRRRLLMLPLFVGFLASALLIGLYFLGWVLCLPNPFSAQYFVPIFGILMGNMLGVNVMGLTTFYAGLQREQQLYYYLLGNGATHSEAIAPFVRQALMRAFNPAIANMAVMGLVALPGTMIGQILGGSSPDVAIKYQMMIIVITISSSMLSLIISIALSKRRAFDSYGRLLPVMQGGKK